MIDNELEKRLAKEVAEFVPSSVDEIKALKLQIGKRVVIQCIETCPFTELSYVSDEKNAEVFDAKVRGSSFDFCLYFTDGYGCVAFASPESVKFVLKGTE